MKKNIVFRRHFVLPISTTQDIIWNLPNKESNCILCGMLGTSDGYLINNVSYARDFKFLIKKSNFMEYQQRKQIDKWADDDIETVGLYFVHKDDDQLSKEELMYIEDFMIHQEIYALAVNVLVGTLNDEDDEDDDSYDVLYTYYLDEYNDGMIFSQGLDSPINMP